MARWRGHERNLSTSDPSQEALRRIIKEIKQSLKKAFSDLQMLTFQTRHLSTNWRVLMVLTFRWKVPRVLTFSKGGLLSESFNSLEPHPPTSPAFKPTKELIHAPLSSAPPWGRTILAALHLTPPK